jgi:hypothetical protein
MMKTYSHVRRLALDQAAAVLEPTFDFTAGAAEEKTIEADASAENATSQVTSQSDELAPATAEILNVLPER